jgi:hypothetical protein
MTKSALAQSQYPIYSGNVYLGKDRHSWCEQCFQFGCIRDILNSREVGDMVSVPGKEMPKLKEPVMVLQQGVISARVYPSKPVEPPARRERAE